MFRIGEFSRLTQVSIRMLRYYDEVGLLRPVQVDPFSGYRVYSAEQIPDLQKLLLLRDSKFTVEEMKQLQHKSWDARKVELALEEKKEQIKKEIAAEQERLKKIEQILSKETRKQGLLDYYVGTKTVPAMYILGCKELLHSYYEESLLWRRLGEFMREEHLTEKKGLYNNVSLYHDLDYRDHDVTVEIGTVVDMPGEDKGGFYYREVEAVEQMAYAMVYGPYSRMADGYAKLAAYLEETKQTMSASPSRQICHIGPCETDLEEEYVTEIQIPLDSHTV